MPPSAGAPLTTPLARLRYAVFGRVVPGVLFSVLGYLQFGHLQHSCDNNACNDFIGLLSGPVTRTLYLLFCVIPVALYITRPMPRARDGRLGARIAALTGTTMLLWVKAYDPSGIAWVPPAAVLDVGAVGVAAFTALEVYALVNLRLNFSIIPEARHLVTTGPYGFVRHPLYFTEIGVVIAGVFTEPNGVRYLSLLIILPFIAVQYSRSVMEEGLLRRVFPEYADYARHTARLIPFVW